MTNKFKSETVQFVQFHRKFSEWEWYKNVNVRAVFQHLILMANWKDIKWQGINLKRGERLTSIKHLSEENGLSEQNIRTILKKLKSTGELTIKSTSKYSIISVTNYDKYQTTNKQTNKQLTNDQQTGNKRLTTDNKENKENKENNKLYNDTCHEIVNYFFTFLSNRETERFEQYRKNYLNIADKLIRIDKFKLQEIKDAINYGKTDTFWSDQFQSFAKLRDIQKSSGLKYIDVFLSKIISQDIKPKKKSLKPSNSPHELIFKFETEVPEEYNNKKDGGL